MPHLGHSGQTGLDAPDLKVFCHKPPWKEQINELFCLMRTRVHHHSESKNQKYSLSYRPTSTLKLVLGCEKWTFYLIKLVSEDFVSHFILTLFVSSPMLRPNLRSWTGILAGLHRKHPCPRKQPPNWTHQAQPGDAQGGLLSVSCKLLTKKWWSFEKKCRSIKYFALKGGLLKSQKQNITLVNLSAP